MTGLRAVRIPFLGGRIAYLPPQEDATTTARMLFATRLYALHRDEHGHEVDDKIAEFVPGKGYDLGSGLVTNVGVLALANDYAWTVTNAPHNVFRATKYHASGIGVAAAAATDIKLGTVSAQGGQTPVAGTQVLVSAANSQKYQSVATITYSGGEAVTEWGFFLYDFVLPAVTALTDATGSPFTAGSATTGTTTGTLLTASSTTVQGQQMSVFDNTNATRVSWGLVTSNTNAVVTVPAWYKTADGTAGTAPVNADTYVIRPVMWDHKVFTAINVVNLDSVQYTYTLTINSGG